MREWWKFGILLFLFFLVALVYSDTPTGNVIQEVSEPAIQRVPVEEIATMPVEIPPPEEAIYEVSFCPHSYMIACEQVRITDEGVFVRLKNVASSPVSRINATFLGPCNGGAYVGNLAVGESRNVKLCETVESAEGFAGKLRMTFAMGSSLQSLSVDLYGDYPR